MAGPTTEVLNEDLKDVKSDLHEIRVDSGVLRAGLQHVNDDIKELKADLRDIRSDISVLKTDLHNVATGLAEFKGQVRVYMGLARWVAALLLTMVLSSGAAGIWWASAISADVKALEKRFDKLELRFDRFEAQITKLVEQGRPAQAVPKAEGSSSSVLK